MLIKDIYTVGSSYPQELTVFNGALYFSADNGTSPNTIPPGVGRELWKTDGTEAGTVLVKDINSGVNGCSPEYLTVLTGAWCFSADHVTSPNQIPRGVRRALV